ncbi:pentapeptide repeat-containing protein [Floridanema evergladense]|uniref:Pentapeptide repeat-containing protein n=1 Tax=Floridaenema evergladense BLCC-F167 TaxID=3153639 RepID=A0ABV4WNF0_9CYAN
MTNDFYRQNLRGRSFKRQDLRGANFSYADIRGSDFTQAILEGTNFSHTKAGLKLSWLIALQVVLLFLATLAGFISAYAGAFVGGILILDNQPLAGLLFVASFTLILFLGFVSITILRGIGTALWLFAVTVVTSIAIFLAFPGADYSRANAILLAIVIAVNISGVLVGAIAVAVSRILSKTWMLVFIGLATLGAAVLGTIAGSEEIIRTPKFVTALVIAIPVTLALVSLSLYIGWRAIVGDKKYKLIRNIAIVLCTYGGTSFRGANLTNADFSYATLKNTDLREANLTRTCWFQTQQVNQSRTEGTYLENPQARQLAVTKNGQEQNFDHLDLRGFNLQDANLINASLIGAKLSEATLCNADLSQAKLVQAQLYGVDLRGACLTGAIIEDWGISTDTKLEQVRCEFIYMRLPTPLDPDPWRKPDNRKENFKEGDFTDFIAPIIKTLTLYQLQNVDTRAIKLLDLYHYEGIDPSAAAIALKQLAEQHPEAGLKVVALEGRGEEKIRLQARVTGNIDRSRLSAEYFEKYQEIGSLPYDDLQSLLAAMAEKDERIRSLENMVMAAMKSDKFYVETYYAFGDSSDEDQTVKKILILTANPQNIDKRRLDAEVREIQTGLERAKKRDQFEIISKWAVRPDDLRRALLDYEPQIVHFSGYGAATEGLALENDLGQLQMVSTAALAKLFEVFKDKVECVLLNACYSETQAEAIRQHIDYVIGMHQAIGNRAAIEFAVGFYDALGAGRSIEDAFKLGCIAIDLEGIPESLTPVLKKKKE